MLHVCVGEDWKYNLVIGDRTGFMLNVQEITTVVVSGEELERALRITGLPRFGVSMKFYGDTAKHIVGNWFNRNGLL